MGLRRMDNRTSYRRNKAVQYEKRDSTNNAIESNTTNTTNTHEERTKAPSPKNPAPYEDIPPCTPTLYIGWVHLPLPTSISPATLADARRKLITI